MTIYANDSNNKNQMVNKFNDSSVYWQNETIVCPPEVITERLLYLTN